VYPHHYWTKVCWVCGWTYQTPGYRAGVYHLCAPWGQMPSLYDLYHPEELRAAREELRASVEGKDADGKTVRVRERGR
jgi:hypothetical protein